MIQTIASASQNMQAQNNRQNGQSQEQDYSQTSFGDALNQAAKNSTNQNGEAKKSEKNDNVTQTDDVIQPQSADSTLGSSFEQSLLAAVATIQNQNVDTDVLLQNLTGDASQAIETSLTTQQSSAEPTALQTMAIGPEETESARMQIPTQTETIAASSDGVRTVIQSGDSMKPGNRFGQIRVQSSVSDGVVDRMTTETDESATAQTSEISAITGSGTTAATQKHAVEALETVLSKWSESDSENGETSTAEKNSISVLENNIQRMTAETQPIKISDASNEISQPTVNQIIQEIKTNLSADQSEFTMQLTPKDLGELTVKMTAKDGILTIEMIASDPKTQNLLSERVGEIQNVLQTSQDKPVQISCPTQEQTQNQDLFSQSESQSQNRDQSDQNQHSDQTETVFQSTESFMNMLQQIELQAV